MSTSVISFALWGNDPMYTYGMIENINRARRVYPNWQVWVYVSEDVSKGLLSVFTALGAKLVPMGAHRHSMGLYWRMLPAFDMGVKRMIVRDADSRVSTRELACVKEWIESGKPLHCMRDHKKHTSPIMGGMWGCVPSKLRALLPGIALTHEKYLKVVSDGECKGGRYGRHKNSDQIFLYTHLWDKAGCDNFIVHDDRHKTKGDLPFPRKNPNPLQFVGQVYLPPNAPKFKV